MQEASSIMYFCGRDATYYLHMETTRTLLTLLSLSQFTVESSSALEVYRLIYQNRQAESFLLTLVSRLISQHKQPEESAGSIILHIAGKLFELSFYILNIIKVY